MIWLALLGFPQILYCAGGPSWLSWTPRPQQILRRSHGSLPRVVGAEVVPTDEVVEAAPGPDLPEPHSGGDAHVRSGIQFIFLAGCSHLFDVHDPCGTHNIWYRLLSLGLTSFGMAISGIFHVALRVGLVTLRPSGG